MDQYETNSTTFTGKIMQINTVSLFCFQTSSLKFYLKPYLTQSAILRTIKYLHPDKAFKARSVRRGQSAIKTCLNSGQLLAIAFTAESVIRLLPGKKKREITHRISEL